jgi:S-formylglutathione hydrolase FrmB
MGGHGALTIALKNTYQEKMNKKIGKHSWVSHKKSIMGTHKKK